MAENLNISLRTGWSPAQSKEFVTVIAQTIGKQKTAAANAV
ncbi:MULTISPECIES: hypothetical protein [Dyadobacter]|nr:MULTISPECIES: hypothetical protein [Dyadobacter]